ncbi:hypothetical protein AB0J40_17265 [Amycolatopsis sp. NPDC049691]|uniref:hypothetical protein n=1 Tax=Amycolatopsis sp. NPDC049691 TaxID=3155155 RepID=UPI00341B5466
MVLMHEYNAARMEQLQSRTTQNSMMTAAVAATAAVFAALLSTWSNAGLRIGILSAAPLFIVILWSVRLAEIMRIGRTSEFLLELERLVNAEVAGGRRTADPRGLDPANALHWESWLRGKNRWRIAFRTGSSYLLTSVLLLGTAFTGTVLAVVYSLADARAGGGLRVFTCLASALWIGVFTYSARWFRHPVVRNRTELVT